MANKKLSACDKALLKFDRKLERIRFEEKVAKTQCKLEIVKSMQKLVDRLKELQVEYHDLEKELDELEAKYGND